MATISFQAFTWGVCWGQAWGLAIKEVPLHQQARKMSRGIWRMMRRLSAQSKALFLNLHADICDVATQALSGISENAGETLHLKPSHARSPARRSTHRSACPSASGSTLLCGASVIRPWLSSVLLSKNELSQSIHPRSDAVLDGLNRHLAARRKGF